MEEKKEINNKEKSHEYWQNYKKAHPGYKERHRLRQARYYAAWTQEQKDAFLERQRTYYQANKKRILENQKKYRGTIPKRKYQKKFKPILDRIRFCLTCGKPIDPTWRSEEKCHRHL